MDSRGPSPVVPFLLVALLGWIIYGSYLQSLLEDYVVPVLEGGPFLLGLVVVLLLLLLQLLSSSSFSSSWFSSISLLYSPATTTAGSSEGDGFGLGAFLLLVLFFILYNTMSRSGDD